MTRREWATLIVGLLTFAPVVIAMVLSTKPSRASDFDWIDRHAYPERYERKRIVRRKRYYAAPREREFTIIRDEDDDPRFCMGPVRGVGTQWIGEDVALQNAHKDWMERVRYDLGETFIDMGHALDYRKRCGRTSIGETLGQVLYRCEVIARPCKAEFSEGEGKTK